MQQQTYNRVLSLSFNTYTSDRLTDIAARVVQECQNDDESDHFDDLYHDRDLYCDEKFGDLEQNRFSLRLDEQSKFGDLEQNRFSLRLDEQSKFEQVTKHDCDDEDREEKESEFTFNCRESETTSPISADDIFYNGQIKPCYYPLFDTNLLLDHRDDHENDDDDNTVQINTVLNLDLNLNSNNDSKITSSSPPTRRLSLRNLMKEDFVVDHVPSCSSSDADELEGFPPGTYCVWKPKTEQESLANRKKSSSTGTSKRWRFRDLLNRSNSEGKDAFVLFPASSKSKRNSGNNKVEKSVSFAAGTPKGNSYVDVAAAARVMKEDEKRRSFLPYKQELFGIFANGNGLSRNLHPF